MPRKTDPTNEQQVVEFLAGILELHVPTVRCDYSADSPFAYSYPLAEEAFGCSSQEARVMLEDLVTEGLLERRLATKVHLCASCGWHTLNFVETCPRCRSLDIEIETVLHHFSCAYVGPWSEFKRGVDLYCPKCDEQLRHMGMDYERPADTYVCAGCEYAFTDSSVEAQCLRCRETTAAEEVPPFRIYEYIPTPKTTKAVDAGRITGLDIKSILFEDRSHTFRRDFLVFEVDREIYRARRYDSSLSMILMDVEGLDAAEGGDTVEASRDLDVVSSESGGWAAVLLPETPPGPACRVAERLRSIVSDFQSVGDDEPLSSTIAVAELLTAHEAGQDFLDYVTQILAWALENRPGTVVSADAWMEEIGHAK